MRDYKALIEKAKEAGFSHVAPLDCTTIRLEQEVRSMCEADKCSMYNKNWACPPGCGTLDECGEKVKRYKTGLIVQTTGELEDAMDGETMMETQELHQENFAKFREYLQEFYPGMLALGAGCCTKCKKCTYPDEPCRFPDKAISSMEAYGMLVTQVCEDNQMPYYYGDCTITYTGCYLLE